MRAFRKNTFRSRLFNVVSQLLILAFSFLVCLWMISGAKAAVTNNLKEIVSNASGETRTIEIIFDADLKKENVKSSYERDFLQFSVEEVTAFPAKTTEISSQFLQKVYAYQYQPNQARARIYLKGNPRDLMPAISWTVAGNKIVLSFDRSKTAGAKHKESPQVSTVQVQDKVESFSAANSKIEEKPSLSHEEELLLQRMTERQSLKESAKISKEPKEPAVAPVTPAAVEKIASAALDAKNANPSAAAIETNELFSGMKQDSQHQGASHAASGGFGIGKIILNLALVLALIAAIAWGFRKFVLKKGLSLGVHNKAIRVLSTYSLSPGKTLTVVKVADEYLVLGVAGNTISLISTLDRASGIEKYFSGDSGFSDGAGLSKSLFSSFLKREAENDSVMLDDDSLGTPAGTASQPRKTEPSPAPAPSVRDTIKKNLRGYKQLT